MTPDFSKAPSTETKKPKKEEAVQYAGVEHAWGHKQSLQGKVSFWMQGLFCIVLAMNVTE